MILAQNIARHIHRGRPFAGEIIQTRLPSQGLIA